MTTAIWKPAGTALVAVLAACASRPVADEGLTTVVAELTPWVAEQLAVEPRPVKAFYNDGRYPGIDAGLVFGVDWRGRETGRWICIERGIEPRPLRVLLAHEIVHVHVADWNLSLIEDDGLACLVSYSLDPECGAEEIRHQEHSLAATGRTLEWARSLTLAEFKPLPRVDKESFYLLAYRYALERWGDNPSRANPQRRATSAGQALEPGE